MGKREQSSLEFEVRQSGAAYAVGGFIFAFSSLLLALELCCPKRAVPAWVYLVIAGMFLLGGYVCAEARNRRLLLAEGTFRYRNLWGKTVTFSLEDIAYGKAAYHASKGRDYLRLYGKEGKALCRLECSMRNAGQLIWYLHENGVPLELEKGAEGFAGDILGQQAVTEEEMVRRSRQIYGQAQALVAKWQMRNERMGAELTYGFACYCRGKMKGNARRQPEGSRFLFPDEDGEGMWDLPEDFYCRLELYAGKAGELVQDRRGRLLMLETPVFYRKESGEETKKAGRMPGGAAEGEICRLYYNSGWQQELEEGLGWLETYLPRHKFMPADIGPEGMLMKELPPAKVRKM